jgi:hypothetical protein
MQHGIFHFSSCGVGIPRQWEHVVPAQLLALLEAVDARAGFGALCQGVFSVRMEIRRTQGVNQYMSI